jgi:hypothetical protein
MDCVATPSIINNDSLFVYANSKGCKKTEYKLMSIRDSRIMIIAHLFTDHETESKLHNQMLERHKNRKRDIERYYLNDF